MKNYKFSLLCLGLVVLLIINFISSFIRIEQTGIFNEEEKLKVVVDAGHGGEDGGVSETGGIVEKDINLAVALYLKDLLEENGYEVIMTRDEDEDLADSTLETVSERKKSDLYNRVDIINKSDAVLVVSIHQNHFEQEKYKGAQVFYYTNESKVLAETLQADLIEKLTPDNNRVAKEIDNKFLLEESIIPAVIVECGFLSNKNEAILLSSDEYQQKIANAIYAGLSKYLENEKISEKDKIIV